VWTPRINEPQVMCLHNNEGPHDKIYVVRIDIINTDALALATSSPNQVAVVASWGKRTARVLQNMEKGRFSSIAEARSRAGALIVEKTREGYHRASLDLADGKIDISRIFAGVSDSQVSQSASGRRTHPSSSMQGPIVQEHRQQESQQDSKANNAPQDGRVSRGLDL